MKLLVQKFKESWAPTAARYSLLIRVFACPDRLTKHQLSHFAFGKTQVIFEPRTFRVLWNPFVFSYYDRHLAFFLNS